MIVMNLSLNNIYSFNDFTINMAYPKKIVNSTIENEFLSGCPNFRYKKLVILMGANASGKTTLGRALMGIYNFISKKVPDHVVSCINDKNKDAFFSIDFVANTKKMYRIEATIHPTASDSYREEDIDLVVKAIPITKQDSYETCAKKIEALESKQISYIKALEEVESFGWFFSYPNPENNIKMAKDFDRDKFLSTLRIVLSALDPSVREVREGADIAGSYVIKLGNHDLILTDDKILNDGMLSSGTKSGIDIAILLTSIMTRRNGFYYCDEKFSYIHSDMEKEILAKMIEKLGNDEQFFFTTHNTDLLDMALPKHSYVFLQKNKVGEGFTVKCIYADAYLKRNTDSLKKAVENDLFSIAPNMSLIEQL
ncbi:AAA family ATPase [Sphaerochaeta sp. PS]|uniref:AAA family ATPase n=1 Tax=Sphaerochaeta sp. PS TaxID=3076336 RepID=UPI0028A53259|nr:AAA family ATPase [Sphaerochaeta sp. PS]MDT4761800.1 AAA family ATPase [Sphaerochaeta sp. PS]